MNNNINNQTQINPSKKIQTLRNIYFWKFLNEAHTSKKILIFSAWFGTFLSIVI